MAVGGGEMRQCEWFWQRQGRAGKQAERGHHEKEPKETMRPKHCYKSKQTKCSSQANPFNPLLGVVCQPAPQIGRKNTADLK